MKIWFGWFNEFLLFVSKLAIKVNYHHWTGTENRWPKTYKVVCIHIHQGFFSQVKTERFCSLLPVCGCCSCNCNVVPSYNWTYCTLMMYVYNENKMHAKDDNDTDLVMSRTPLWKCMLIFVDIFVNESSKVSSYSCLEKTELSTDSLTPWTLDQPWFVHAGQLQNIWILLCHSRFLIENCCICLNNMMRF